MAELNRKREKTPGQIRVENERRRRLDQINEQIRELGFMPFASLGDHKKGEVELERIMYVHPYTTVTVISFAVIWPDGQHGQRDMIFNQKPVQADPGQDALHISGSHCIVTLNREWFVFTQQYRETMSGWNDRPIEVTRGFNWGDDILEMAQTRLNFEVEMPIPVSDAAMALPVRVVKRKLGPLMNSGLVQPREARILGVVAENPGMVRVFNLYLHLGLEARPEDLERVLTTRGTQAMKIHFLRIEDVYNRFYELGVGSQPCTSTLWYFDRMVYRHWNT